MPDFTSMQILGENLRFWGGVVVGISLKTLLTPAAASRKEAIGSMVAGAAAAFYGTDWVIRKIDSLSADDRDLVVIGLVLTGEHIVRTFLTITPEVLKGKITGLGGKKQL